MFHVMTPKKQFRSKVSRSTKRNFSPIFIVEVQLADLFLSTDPTSSCFRCLSGSTTTSKGNEGDILESGSYMDRRRGCLCGGKFEKSSVRVASNGLICIAPATPSEPQRANGSSWIPALREDPVPPVRRVPTKPDSLTSELLSTVSLSSFTDNLMIIEEEILKQEESFGVSKYSVKSRDCIRIQLQHVDEIHVIPCQCALKMMGMAPRECINNLKQSDDRISQKHGVNNGKKCNKLAMSRTVSGKTKDDFFMHMYSSTSLMPFSKDKVVLYPEDPTHSSKTSSNHDFFSWLSPTHCFDTLSSASFVGIDYHEITLIRKSQPTVFDEIKDLVDWSFVTMRCSSHDEMDELIHALRVSSKAIIIPFSQNPTAVLEKMAISACEGQNSIPEDTSNQLLIKSEADTPESSISCKMLSPSPDNQQPPASLNVREPPLIKKVDRKNLWSKADFCEYCSIHFTLLVRRHHCRKCDKSCCEDCSKLFIVQGGEEVRLCNRCNFNVVLQQSTPKRHRRTDSKCPLGKINPSCDELGVGIHGSLPHWQSYLTFNPSKRPAVGRITVEVIEALALQRMDFNLKSNPYVRATVSGYDYDLEWNLQEWQVEKRFSLNTSYCSSTLSPVWRGPGKLGGELLTLPVISTSGCILRLEVFHCDATENASDTHPLIGIVEIPLSDITNANLRAHGTSHTTQDDNFDGFVERWYYLEKPNKYGDSECVVLARPIDSPLQSIVSIQAISEKRSAMTKFVHSMDEIGQVAEKLLRAPVEWIGAAIGIELPQISKPDRRTKSAIHVRIKLNLSEFGDFISHSWFPPVNERPKRPQFEPEVTYSRLVCLSRIAAPYIKIVKFFGKCMEWKRPVNQCICFYFGVIFHIFLFHKLWILLHFYAVMFLSVRIQKMRKVQKRVSSKVTFADAGVGMVEQGQGGSTEEHSVPHRESSQSETSNELIIEGENQINDADGNLCPPSPSLADLKGNSQSTTGEVKDEESARLNKAIVWISKRLLSSRGMDAFQFKLGKISRDVSKFNSLWDGSSLMKSSAALVVVLVSFVLHCYVSIKLFWVIVITIIYFGPSPLLQKFVRWNFGLSRGFAKALRRRHLHLMEEEKYKKWS